LATFVDEPTRRANRKKPIRMPRLSLDDKSMLKVKAIPIPIPMSITKSNVAMEFKFFIRLGY
jgi:hypothetical protein